MFINYDTKLPSTLNYLQLLSLQHQDCQRELDPSQIRPKGVCPTIARHQQDQQAQKVERAEKDAEESRPDIRRREIERQAVQGLEPVKGVAGLSHGGGREPVGL